YSPEGIMASCAQTSSTCGPEGLTWEMKDGEPILTEFGKKALFGEEVEVQAEWGSGTWKDGISTLNYKAVNPLDINPETGLAYTHVVWDSVLNRDATELVRVWRKTTGSDSTMDLL